MEKIKNYFEYMLQQRERMQGDRETNRIKQKGAEKGCNELGKKRRKGEKATWRQGGRRENRQWRWRRRCGGRFGEMKIGNGDEIGRWRSALPMVFSFSSFLQCDEFLFLSSQIGFWGDLLTTVNEGHKGKKMRIWVGVAPLILEIVWVLHCSSQLYGDFFGIHPNIILIIFFYK